MLEKLGAISTKLIWAKPIVALGGISCLTVFALTILSVGIFDDDKYLVPSLLIGFWCGLCWIMVSGFAYMPAKPDKETTFITRTKIRVKRSIYGLLGIVFLGLTSAVVVVSFRLMRIWLSS